MVKQLSWEQSVSWFKSNKFAKADSQTSFQFCRRKSWLRSSMELEHLSSKQKVAGSSPAEAFQI